MNADPSLPLVVVCLCDTRRAEAATLAERLEVPLLFGVQPTSLDEPDFAMVAAERGWALQRTGRKAPGPVEVDFLAGTAAHRRHYGGGKGQMIARAVGVKAHVYPFVLDATAGLGQDAFVLATLGCEVMLYERSPVVHCLLSDGLARAAAGARGDVSLQAIVERMRLVQGESRLTLESFAAEPNALARVPDVIYLDPMFPERTKSADVKKEMQAFHALLGSDSDADALLAPALATARYRVVVKRPRKAPALAGLAPTHRIEGKSSRFDVYAVRRLPERLNAPGSRASE